MVKKMRGDILINFYSLHLLQIIFDRKRGVKTLQMHVIRIVAEKGPLELFLKQ